VLCQSVSGAALQKPIKKMNEEIASFKARERIHTEISNRGLREFEQLKIQRNKSK
jgi:hypothetical protein